MDYVQQEKMRRTCDKFVEQVEPVHLLPYLPSLNPPSRQRVEARRNENGTFEAAQLLHDFLLKRPIYEELLAALRHPNVGMNHLADLIDAPVSCSTHTNGAAPNVPTGRCNIKTHPITTATGAAVSASSAASRAEPHLGTGQTCCITTPWIELPASVQPALRMFDIGNSLRKYDDLAGILGLTIQEFNSIKHTVPQRESKTLAFIENWNQRNPINLGDLLRVFHALDRVDIITELENITGVKYESKVNELDGVPGDELAAGSRLNLELPGNGYLADNPRPNIGSSQSNVEFYKQASNLIPSQQLTKLVPRPISTWKHDICNIKQPAVSKTGSSNVMAKKANTYDKDADKKFNDKKLSMPTSRKEENTPLKHNTKSPTDTPRPLDDKEISVKTYCYNSENVAANSKEKLLAKSFTSRPALKPDNKNGPIVTQNSIDACSSVREETEIVHETVNDEPTGSNRSTGTENCSLANMENLDKVEFERRLLNPDKINEERLVHEQYEVRRLENRSEGGQNISDLILQNDFSLASFSTDVGAIARKDGCKQFDVTDTTQYEDYSLEDERALAPKIPSITKEQESISKKAEAPFPSHLLLSDWNCEIAENSEQSFQIDDENVVSTDGEVPVLDEESLHHLTIQRSDVTEFPVNPHYPQTECETECEGNILDKETFSEKLNADCNKFGQGSPDRSSELLENSSDVKLLDTFQNTGKLYEETTNASRENFQSDKDLFPEQINDANFATNSVSADDNRYGNTGIRHDIEVRGLRLTGDHAITSRQACACVKENAIAKSCSTDIVKGQYFRMSIFKIIQISYDNML